MIAALLSILITASGPQWIGEEPANKTRIVSLVPSLTEVVFALGAGNQIVAVSKFDTFPESVKSLPQMGGIVDFDVEAIVAQKPDFILCVPSASAQNKLKTLAALGYPSLILASDKIEDLWTAIDSLGTALSRQKEAKALQKRLKSSFKKLSQRYQAQARPKVVMVVGRRPLVVAGPDSFLVSLLSQIHVKNAVISKAPYPVVDLETIMLWGPDILIDLSPGSGKDAARYWQRLPSVASAKTRLVHHHDDALLKPGPRLPEGLGRLAEKIHTPPNTVSRP